MHYNPQDPRNFAFYQTYLDDDAGARAPKPGCASGCSIVALMVILCAVLFLVAR